MRRLLPSCDTLPRMPTRKPASVQRPEERNGLPTKEHGDKNWAARKAEQAARERKQVRAMLRAYREFADIWQTGLKNASSFSEFAIFIGPSARVLAEEARLLEIVLAEHDEAQGRQRPHAD